MQKRRQSPPQPACAAREQGVTRAYDMIRPMVLQGESLPVGSQKRHTELRVGLCSGEEGSEVPSRFGCSRIVQLQDVSKLLHGEEGGKG